MTKIVPAFGPSCNKKLSSIEKLQQAELKRQAYFVRKQEFKRELENERMPVIDPPVVDPQQVMNFQAPRTCNTGALIPSPNITKVDWLEFTVKSVEPFTAVAEYLGLDWSVFAVNDFGLQGYADSATYGHCKVLWSEHKPERGTKIILSAKALDEVAKDAVQIIALALRDGGTFARIDLATDDKSGDVVIDDIFQAVEQRYDVNRFTQVEIRQPIDRRTGEYAGRSVYWGKASSSRQVVFYDKEIEQFRKTGEKTGPWLRCEARWKKRAANIAAVVLAERGLAAALSLIRGVIDFRLQDNEKTDRRTLCPWWERWVANAQPIKTGVKKIVKTIEEKASWLGRQMSKTMGQVAALMDGETILEMIRAGIHATTPAEWKQLDPHNKRVLLTGSGAFDTIIPF